VEYSVFIGIIVRKTLKSPIRYASSFFEDAATFRAWLLENHDKEKALLVGFYKVGSGKASMTWSESVDQALCFGWIDGVRKSIDQERYCIRFTPRKPNSIWSAVNINKIEVLSQAGLMQEAGLKAFALRKEEKSKIYSHEKASVALAAVYEAQFKENEEAWTFFIKQAPSYRKVIIHWIMSAQQEKTRQTRLAKTIAASEKQQRVE